MILKIDTASSTPVYAQIVDQIRRAIASGALKSGDSLPSLRETAIKLRINPLTVAKAYKLLEQEGLVETRHGLGTFVTAEADEAADSYRYDTLIRSIDNLLADAYQLGVSFDEVKRLIDQQIESARSSYAREIMERSSEDDK